MCNVPDDDDGGNEELAELLAAEMERTCAACGRKPVAGMGAHRLCGLCGRDHCPHCLDDDGLCAGCRKRLASVEAVHGAWANMPDALRECVADRLLADLAGAEGGAA